MIIENETPSGSDPKSLIIIVNIPQPMPNTSLPAKQSGDVV